MQQLQLLMCSGQCRQGQQQQQDGVAVCPAFTDSLIERLYEGRQGRDGRGPSSPGSLLTSVLEEAALAASHSGHANPDMLASVVRVLEGAGSDSRVLQVSHEPCVGTRRVDMNGHSFPEGSVDLPKYRG